MDQLKIRKAQAFINEEAKSRVSRHSEHPDNYIIITPDIFASMQYRLPEIINCPILFISFDKRSALRIPHKIVFRRPVIISQSIIGGIADCVFEDDLILHDVEYDFKHSLPNIQGYLAMDEESFEAYRNKRCKTLDRTNRPVAVLSAERMREILLDSFNKTVALNFEEYLKATGYEFKYIKREGTYYIEGDLILHGPIRFTVPKGLVVKGDLILIDEAGFKMPKRLDVSGEIDIIGSL